MRFFIVSFVVVLILGSIVSLYLISLKISRVDNSLKLLNEKIVINNGKSYNNIQRGGLVLTMDSLYEILYEKLNSSAHLMEYDKLSPSHPKYFEFSKILTYASNLATRADDNSINDLRLYSQIYRDLIIDKIFEENSDLEILSIQDVELAHEEWPVETIYFTIEK